MGSYSMAVENVLSRAVKRAGHFLPDARETRVGICGVILRDGYVGATDGAGAVLSKIRGLDLGPWLLNGAGALAEADKRCLPEQLTRWKTCVAPFDLELALRGTRKSVRHFRSATVRQTIARTVSSKAAQEPVAFLGLPHAWAAGNLKRTLAALPPGDVLVKISVMDEGVLFFEWVGKRVRVECALAPLRGYSPRLGALEDGGQ